MPHKFLDPKFLIIIAIGLLTLAGCELFEEPPSSPPFDNAPPETYLTISSQSIIIARLDSVVCDSTGLLCDSAYSYYFEVDSLQGDSIPPAELDTLRDALQTVLASTQTMSWWGEDPDGDIIGYYYKWKHDLDWTYTTNESKTFIVPIRTAFDIFGFAVKAMDSDSLVDPTPAEIILPVRNTRPEISFRYQSNPVVNNPNLPERTFLTRTFLWAVADDDGLETVDSIYYALDSTLSWYALPASEKGITLSESSEPALTPGTHVFYLKAKDIAGAESEIVHYPDINDDSTPNTWEVMEPSGDVLLVDDFPFDPNNYAMAWYQSVLDTIPGIGIDAGGDGYSVWEIGSQLPFSETDVVATLGYFKHLIWYSAINGPEMYGDAANPIYQFVLRGGNVFINVTELKSTATTWFPFDSREEVNPNGRLFPETIILSSINPDLDLETSKTIPYRFSSFALNDTSGLSPDGPTFTPLYRMAEPSGTDPWIGTPIVAAEYDHRSPLPENLNAGKVILFSIPMHDGTSREGGATMEGNDSAGKFISWVLQQRFMP
ncbi:hypothetical protein ACFL4U_01165 [Candidatus Neomarinimicrobiota bacterium]